MGQTLNRPEFPKAHYEYEGRIRERDNSFAFLLVMFMLVTMALGTTVLVQHQKIRRLEALLTTSVETP